MSCECQSSILPDGAKFGLFIESDLKSRDYEGIAKACMEAYSKLVQIKSQHPNEMVGMSIGFGSKLWNVFAKTVDGVREGAEIRDFTPYGEGLAPATQHDLFIHIQSMRQDLNITLATQVWDLFDSYLEAKDETHGYRLLENRGHEGFVDGTENPKEAEAVKAAVIADGCCDAGGSYVMVQKYIHDMKKWNALSESTQEEAVGRRKESDEEIEDKLIESHVGRTDISEDGESLKVLRRSLPWGKVSGDHGLLYCSYCARLHNIDKQLKSMFGDLDGKIDLLVQHFSKAVSGSFYFVPNQDRLRNLKVEARSGVEPL
ncbi:Dyp-type peroxidase [Taylorella equigenitalis]|uniref:Dyp-type peroxidase n=1 Tax=Taylorella equigenitalis TaxID=29575 RepID=UPI000BAC776D|nr:Dyp-type peroxidase [Taylorella equigenitalis]ASY41131.1 peroxidase [Taylorella equigenitalis]